MMTDTRSAILIEAENYVRSMGYTGFSYADIAVKLGIKKASVHYHYASKDQLGSAIVEKQISDFETWCFHMEQKNLEPIDLVRNYIRRSEIYIKDGKSLSPIVMMQSELSRLSDEIKKLIREYGKREHIWLKKVFSEAIEKGQISSENNPSQLALMVGSFIQGASQVGRTFGIDYYKTATSQLFQLIK